MADNLQKLINLAKADGGKFFVLDDKGTPSLVIMSVDQYEKLLVGRLQNQAADIEEINRQIAEAQRQNSEQQGVEQKRSSRQQQQDALKSEIIDSTFSFEE